MINLFHPYISVKARQDVNEVLKGRWIGQGPKVDQVEKKFSRMFKVAYPVTVNNCTAALHLALILAGIKPGDEVISTPLTCVSSKTPVLLPNGKTAEIRKLVRQKYKGFVMSYNLRKNRLEKKRVIGWYRAPLGQRRWYRINYQNCPHSRGHNDKRGVWVTNDHPILTTKGYKKAEELKYSDKVVTTEKMFNKKQMEMAIGAILGDAYLQGSARKTSKRCRLYFGHVNRQKEWLQIKVNALKGINFKYERRKKYKQSKAATLARSTYSYQGQLLKERFYQNGKKVVPKNLTVKDFSLLTLATWYMDDGSLAGNAALLCTENYSFKEVRQLSEIVAKMGFSAYPQKAKKGAAYRVFIPNNDKSATKFFKAIAKFIPPSIRYKLPKKIVEEIPYNSKVWDLGEAEFLADKVIIDKRSSPHWDEHPNYTYCIDVEDNHNFITANLILHNCTATNIPVLYCGAKVVFADIQKESINIDPKSIKEKITPKTKAIMVVHWAGYPCDMDEIQRIAKKHNLIVIEDAAQALGSKYKNKYIGSISQFTCFSFQAVKPVTAVDGGMLCVLNKRNYKKAKLLRWYGIDREFQGDIYKRYRMVKDIGFKYHMNDMTAVILSSQLDEWWKINSRREQIARRYIRAFKNVPGITLLERKSDRQTSNWTFTMYVEKRDDFQRKLAENGIESSLVHIRNDISPIFGGRRQDLPVMNEIEGKYISIPLHNHLKDKDVEKIIRTIKSGW